MGYRIALGSDFCISSAETQKIFPFDREYPEYAEFWPASQPMVHLKTFIGRFILQVSIKL